MPGWYLTCLSHKQEEHFHDGAGARQGTRELHFGEDWGDASVLMQDFIGLWCFP